MCAEPRGADARTIVQISRIQVRLRRNKAGMEELRPNQTSIEFWPGPHRSQKRTHRERSPKTKSCMLSKVKREERTNTSETIDCLLRRLNEGCSLKKERSKPIRGVRTTVFQPFPALKPLCHFPREHLDCSERAAGDTAAASAAGYSTRVKNTAS